MVLSLPITLLHFYFLYLFPISQSHLTCAHILAHNYFLWSHLYLLLYSTFTFNLLPVLNNPIITILPFSSPSIPHPSHIPSHNYTTSHLFPAYFPSHTIPSAPQPFLSALHSPHIHPLTIPELLPYGLICTIPPRRVHLSQSFLPISPFIRHPPTPHPTITSFTPTSPITLLHLHLAHTHILHALSMHLAAHTLVNKT